MSLDRFSRTAISSATYEEKLKNAPKLSTEQKKSRLKAILSADERTAMRRIGQGMIGPIQIRLRYEGMVRNVLVEDTLERGPLMPYDILDDLGVAYSLSTVDGEVRTTPFEGKQATPSLFRIATFPRLKKEDLYLLRVNIVEYAQDESRQAIQKQEDARLIILLEDAIEDLGKQRGNTAGVSETVGALQTGGVATGVAAGPAGHVNEQTVVIGAGTALEPADFYNAVAQIEINQLEANKVLMHPTDARDLYTWDINTTGFKFKDEVFAGSKITTFGEFQIQKSIMVPQGETFLVADPEFVGVFPVMYSLDVEENHLVQQFYKGWVLDEMVGMLVLNPRSIARVVKASAVPYSGYGALTGEPTVRHATPPYVWGGTDI